MRPIADVFAHIVTNSHANASLDAEGHAGPECAPRNARSNFPANQDCCPLGDSDTDKYSDADPDTYEHSDADPYAFANRSSHGILERSADYAGRVG